MQGWVGRVRACVVRLAVLLVDVVWCGVCGGLGVGWVRGKSSGVASLRRVVLWMDAEPRDAEYVMLARNGACSSCSVRLRR